MLDDLILKKLLKDKPNWLLVDFCLNHNSSSQKKFRIHLVDPTKNSTLIVESDTLSLILDIVKTL